MKKRRCWRYTCEHCKKSGCSAPAIMAHEGRCFNNPIRRCPMCESQWPRPELMAIMEQLDYDKPQDIVPTLEAAAENCPACVVSAWRQANPKQEVESGWNDDQGFTRTIEIKIYLEYDYNAKAGEYIKEKRREEASEYSGLGMF